MGSCTALMSVKFDPPGAPDYYPGFSTAAIRRPSISRNKFLPGTHLLNLGRVWQMQINVLPKDISASAGLKPRTL